MVELLKYPITVFSIFLALVGARYLLGITFGQVSKLSTEGVEFATEATQQLTALESKLNGVLAEVEAMKKVSSRQPSELGPQWQARIAEAQQTVSDQAVKLSRSVANLADADDRLRGWIWIGDYRTDWDRVKLGALESGQPISIPPGQMQAGTEYRLLANMVVRDGRPSNDRDYFNARKSLGVLPAGTVIRLVNKPVDIDREFAMQWWAEVEGRRDARKR